MASLNVKNHLISKKYHKEIEAWQQRNFPDIQLLTRYWKKHFPEQEEWVLCAKTSDIRTDIITQGKYINKNKFEKASEMKGSMLYQALRIVKAQCSTELGSIQQHVETVDESTTDYAKFSILRIMAEELRHAYQMFWVLSHDESWASTGDKKIADNLMDELLSMNTGSHVLDAFNIEFTDPLDNIVFACFIDRVGKFQLSMQEEFSYKPMSASMRPMLVEEAFHLQTGWEVLREICIAAVTTGGRSLDEVQRSINLWYPRALEMFGSVEGGESNLQFSFKSMSNADALSGYIKEVEALMLTLNAAIVSAREPGLARKDIIRKVKESQPLYLPAQNFLRMRADTQVAGKLFDVSGNTLSKENYSQYLTEVLPEKFLNTDFGKKYTSNLLLAS